MTSLDRRQFLRVGSLAAVAALCPHTLHGAILTAPRMLDVPADLHALAAAALEAATAAGARYSDVQFRTTRTEDWGIGPIRQTFTGVGVRALVNGYWGFAAQDGIISIDQAAQLGRTAASLAGRRAASGTPRPIEFAPTPVVTGTWVMPVAVDPFTVSLEEKADFRASIADTVSRLQYGITGGIELSFLREDRTFASSEGSFTTQQIYRTQSSFMLGTAPDWMTERSGRRSFDLLTAAGAGWEYIRDSPILEHAARLIQQALSARRPKLIEMGRYDVVFDARATANILDWTVGVATELDRAMGYEANGVGTSYFSDPLDMLGTYTVGSPLLTVMANRSMPGGAATVKWDDEGVAPTETVLVKQGILTDFQTTREAASWLAPYYEKTGTPVRSNGCAGVYGATSPMQQFNPNLVMHPATQDVTFDDLVKSTKKGLAILGGDTTADYQALNGAGSGEIVYEITDGKLVGTISNAQYLYRAPELWKNLVAIGGAASAQTFGIERGRDTSQYRAAHSVSAVPAKITGVAVTDGSRKA